jgi:phosphoesterase RecJ-like protein
MNYKEPTLILEEIKKAKKILVNCHWKPDADSVGSALSMYQLLAGMGKNVKIVSPNNIPKNIKFLPLSDNIDVLNVPKVNFENYDLLILLDTPNVKYFSGGVKFSMPSIKSIVIDHHLTNSGYGDINLIDAEASSTAEMLFRIFEDWGVEIEKNMATTLYAGIVSDSGGFLYPAATANTLKVAASLVGCTLI